MDVVSGNGIVGVPYLHGTYPCCSRRASGSASVNFTSRRTTTSDSTFLFNFSVKCCDCLRLNECSLKRYDLGFRCTSLRDIVYIDAVDEIVDDKWKVNSQRYRPDPQKTTGRVSFKRSNSMSKGNYVENDEPMNNVILQQLCSFGKVYEALRLVELMARRSQIPYFPSCLNLIRGFVKLDHVEKAEKVLKIMVMSGGVPDVEAMQLYREMIVKGAIPDDITHHSLIWGFCHVHKAEEAVEVLREMCRRNHKIRDTAYGLVIHQLCKNQKVDIAIQVLETMISNQSKPNAAIYADLIKGVAAAGMTVEAEQLTSKLSEWNVL